MQEGVPIREHVRISQCLGVVRASLAQSGALMDTQPDPFEQLARAVERALHSYRVAVVLRFDVPQRRAELVAACDLLATAEHPDRAAERDPVPDDLTERVVNAVRDALREREQRTRYPSAVDLVDAYESAQRDAEPQPVREYDDGKPLAEQQPIYVEPDYDDPDWVEYFAEQRAAANGQ